MEDENRKLENDNFPNENLATNDNNNGETELPERKITQTDHLNKHLLNAFLEKLNTTQIPTNIQEQEGEITEVDWCDEQEIITNDREEHTSGPTNSGKTSLTSRLQKSFPGSSHICQDSYFHPPGYEGLTWVPEVQHHNWELFSALDMETMVKDIKGWKEKQLQHENRNPVILLVEGFTIFNYHPLTEFFDKRYFLTATEETCRQRRLTRKNYDPPDVPGYFDKVVWPHYIKTFNEIKDNKDIVFIDEGLSKDEAFTSVKNDIENYLGTL